MCSASLCKPCNLIPDVTVGGQVIQGLARNFLGETNAETFVLSKFITFQTRGARLIAGHNVVARPSVLQD